MRLQKDFDRVMGIILMILILAIPSLQICNKSYTEGDPVIINPVPGLPVDFIRGVDASEAPWIIELGGKYYDENGVERDLLDILKENGVNWIRLRVWNDPYDEQGRPYGGGNCDLPRMTDFAAKAKAKGFGVLIDFHYSDWWADPSKQSKPKAWANLSYPELVEAVYNWTYNALKYMAEHNALPDMVQIGNEINNGFLWPDGSAANWTQFVGLLKAAISAVKDVNPNIKIVIHLAGVKADFYINFIDRLINSGVSFDVIAISFYPYWHGTMDDFRNLVRTLVQRYDKKILVAETAYAWTLDDSDGHPNIFGSRDLEVKGGYKASIQGQASFIRDLIAALYEEGKDKALGIFYWGATWIPYPGAGWKTGEGNPWENQALFDFNGRALPSLKVFRLVYEAQPVEIKPLELYNPSPITVTTYAGSKPILPKTVLVVYTDHSIKPTSVDWGDIPVFDKPGSYTHKGYVKGTNIEVIANITVLEKLSIDITDSKDDDKGIGAYGYPTANVYRAGVFDITHTTFEVMGNNIHIRVYLADLGGNPWNGPNGFSLQYIHIYIRTTNPTITNMIYRKDTFGLNIELREDYQWQYALLITPGWGTAPVPEGELSALYYANGKVFVEDKDFNVTANLDENYIEVIIPRDLMPDWENLRYWRIIVFATSWAGENPDRIRGFAPGGGEWICDATKYAKPGDTPKIASAIVVGILPKFFDMAIYSDEYPNGATAEQQYEWTSKFDPSTKKMAIVPAIQVPTVTVTLTESITTTFRETLTLTVKEVETTIVTTPITTTMIEWIATTIISLVLLIIGFAIGYFIRRK